MPEENLRVLRGGETASRARSASSTRPGTRPTTSATSTSRRGWAFVGDVAGVRIPPRDFMIAPTPPPDIDVEAWERSLEILEGWAPQALALTHFGRVDDVEAHLARLRERLHEAVRLSAAHGREAFMAGIRQRIEENAGDLREAYELAAPPDQLYLGLERWHRKRAEAAGAG